MRTEPLGASAYTATDIDSKRPILLLFGAVCLMSTGLIAIQASEASGVVFAFWRLWVGVLFLGMVLSIWTAVKGTRPGWREFRWVLWPGLALSIAQPLMFTAMELTSVVEVALITSLVPIIVSVIAVPLLAERPGMVFRGWILLAVIGAGVVVVGASSGPSGSPLGIGLALISVTLWSFYMVTIKMARRHLDTLPLLFGTTLVGALGLSVYMLLAAEPIGSMAGNDYWLVVYATVIPGGLGMLTVTWSLRWLPANIPTLVLRAEPVIAGLLAWWLLSEPITIWHLVGAVLTIGGVVGAILSPSGAKLLADEKVKVAITEQL